MKHIVWWLTVALFGWLALVGTQTLSWIFNWLTFQTTTVSAPPKIFCITFISTCMIDVICSWKLHSAERSQAFHQPDSWMGQNLVINVLVMSYIRLEHRVDHVLPPLAVCCIYSAYFACSFRRFIKGICGVRIRPCERSSQGKTLILE